MLPEAFTAHPLFGAYPSLEPYRHHVPIPVPTEELRMLDNLSRAILESDATPEVKTQVHLYYRQVSLASTDALVSGLEGAEEGRLERNERAELRETLARLFSRVDAIGTQLIQLQNEVKKIGEDFNKRIDRLETRVDGIDTKLTTLGGDVQALQNQATNRALSIVGANLVPLRPGDWPEGVPASCQVIRSATHLQSMTVDTLALWAAHLKLAVPAGVRKGTLVNAIYAALGGQFQVTMSATAPSADVGAGEA